MNEELVTDIQEAFDLASGECDALIRKLETQIDRAVMPSAYAAIASGVAYVMGFSAMDREEGEQALFKVFRLCEMMYHEGASNWEEMSDE